LLNYRRVNLKHILLYLAFFYLSTLAVRNIILFAIIAVPLAVFNVEGFLVENRVFKGGGVETALKYIASVVLVLVVGYYLVSLYSNDYYLRNGWFVRNGPGLSEVSYPKEAIDFVQRNGIKGNVFNSPVLGGYFIWRSFPRQKVFFDGRWEVYGDDFHKQYLTMVNNPKYFNDVANSYGVNYAVVDLSSRLSVFLYKDPAWMIVYCDEVAVVFVKNTARNQTAIYNARCDLETEATSDVGTIERSYLERIDEGFLSRMMRLVRLFREGSDPITHFKRGTFFNAMGFKNRAEEELLKSLAMFPHQQMAHNNLGLVYANLGRTDEAIEEYKREIKLNPSFAIAHYNLGLVYGNLGRTDEAIEEYKRAIKLNPSFAIAHYNLGLVYGNLGRTDEAIEEYKEAIRLNPDYAVAHNNLGNAYNNLGRTDEAIEELMLAIRLKPDYAEAHNNLGLAYAKRGMTDEAIEELMLALRLKPDFVEARNNLGLAYFAQGRTEGAIREFRLALSLSPQSVSALTNLGIAYSRQGRIDDAIEQFKQALMLDPDSVEIHFNLGIAYRDKGLKDEAIREFERGLEIRPDDVWALKILRSLSR
jgi:tetratricopeptide (TPR) repeat protein